MNSKGSAYLGVQLAPRMLLIGCRMCDVGARDISRDRAESYPRVVKFSTAKRIFTDYTMTITVRSMNIGWKSKKTTLDS